jgi:hypothetical protein
VLRLCSLPLWERLSEGRRRREFEAFPQLKRHWQHLQHAKQNKDKDKDGKAKEKVRGWLP